MPLSPPSTIMLSWLTAILAVASLAQPGTLAGVQATFTAPTIDDWNQLKKDVGGRLFQGEPFAKYCFSGNWNSSECLNTRESYVDEVTRAEHPAGYIQTQWETCQTSGEQCLLNYRTPHDEEPTLPPRKCSLGSVPGYFIDVQTASDVAAAFEFSKKNAVPLVIKNTGHDYKGRSSAPGSLGLWTHNLKDISYSPKFVPTGCSVPPRQAVTAGAGVQWGDAYEFADSNNITLVGGSDRSVGIAGGWLQGGGHGALSPSMGMGVDRVLEFKVVTPNGQLRIANECQNTDLFWALRGGGGGTFGVVLEITTLASPSVKLQTLILIFAADTELSRELWTIMADNQIKWSEEGWGGFSRSNVVILLNPKMSRDKALVSLAPLLEFGKRLQESAPTTTRLVSVEFPTWGAFFRAFTADFVANTGSSLALASRLIPKASFETAESKSELVSALLATNAATPGLIILISPPAVYAHVPGSTSFTDAFRRSLYHITVISPWNWNATLSEKRENYDRASASIDNLRKITPDAAYQNEADVYEPNHEVSFWGDNYDKLLQLKNKFDPDHLLDCWQCVGWNRQSSRFSCYV